MEGLQVVILVAEQSGRHRSVALSLTQILPGVQEDVQVLPVFELAESCRGNVKESEEREGRSQKNESGVHTALSLTAILWECCWSGKETMDLRELQSSCSDW